MQSGSTTGRMEEAEKKPGKVVVGNISKLPEGNAGGAWTPEMRQTVFQKRRGCEIGREVSGGGECVNGKRGRRKFNDECLRGTEGYSERE